MSIKINKKKIFLKKKKKKKRPEVVLVAADCMEGVHFRDVRKAIEPT